MSKYNVFDVSSNTIFDEARDYQIAAFMAMESYLVNKSNTDVNISLTFSNDVKDIKLTILNNIGNELLEYLNTNGPQTKNICIQGNIYKIINEYHNEYFIMKYYNTSKECLTKIQEYYQQNQTAGKSSSSKKKESKEDNNYKRTGKKYNNNRCIYRKGNGKTEYVRHNGEFITVKMYDKIIN